MCFAIPEKIKEISKGMILTEDNKTVQAGDLKLTSGDYVRVYGNMAVEKIDKKEAVKIRKLIKSEM